MKEPQPNSLLREEELKEIRELFGGIADPMLLILKVHLYTEHLMERLILAALPRGDRVLENGNLSYAQKIALVSALDCVGDQHITGLRSLNKIRNACSHERDKVITAADIDLLGRAYGNGYTTLKKTHGGNFRNWLSATLGWLCGGLLHHANRLENQASNKSTAPV